MASLSSEEQAVVDTVARFVDARVRPRGRIYGGYGYAARSSGEEVCEELPPGTSPFIRRLTQGNREVRTR